MSHGEQYLLDIDFIRHRTLHAQSHGDRRCYGMSSNALANYALGWAPEPQEWDYPHDHGDLAACERTYRIAPPHLQERMLPTLVKYRAFVEQRYGVLDMATAGW